MTRLSLHYPLPSAWYPPRLGPRLILSPRQAEWNEPSGEPTHLYGMTFSISSPDELAVVIPHLLGVKPEESTVFLPMGSELLVARVDLPTTGRDRDIVWRSISDASGRYAQPGSSIAIVCLTADPNQASVVGHDFAVRFESVGIDTDVTLCSSRCLVRGPGRQGSWSLGLV